jgi:hypothetical protein
VRLDNGALWAVVVMMKRLKVKDPDTYLAPYTSKDTRADCRNQRAVVCTTGCINRAPAIVQPLAFASAVFNYQRVFTVH